MLATDENAFLPGALLRGRRRRSSSARPLTGVPHTGGPARPNGDAQQMTYLQSTTGKSARSTYSNAPCQKKRPFKPSTAFYHHHRRKRIRVGAPLDSTRPPRGEEGIDLWRYRSCVGSHPSLARLAWHPAASNAAINVRPPRARRARRSGRARGPTMADGDSRRPLRSQSSRQTPTAAAP